jgi:hypothetical protein
MAQSAGLKMAVKALVSLSQSDHPIASKAIDAIVDPYLIFHGKFTSEHRIELATAFLELASSSARTKDIHQRILSDT